MNNNEKINQIRDIVNNSDGKHMTSEQKEGLKRSLHQQVCMNLISGKLNPLYHSVYIKALDVICEDIDDGTYELPEKIALRKIKEWIVINKNNAMDMNGKSNATQASIWTAEQFDYVIENLEQIVKEYGLQ